MLTGPGSIYILNLSKVVDPNVGKSNFGKTKVGKSNFGQRKEETFAETKSSSSLPRVVDPNVGKPKVGFTGSQSCDSQQHRNISEPSVKTTTTITPELPTGDEPAPAPLDEAPRSCSHLQKEKSKESELSELSELRANPPQAAPDSHLAEGTLAQDELIFPAKLSPAEVVLAWQLVCLFTLLDAQTLLDELAWRLDPRHSQVHTPLSFLRTLCERHKAGTFQPSGAIQVRKAREAARRQAAREAAARQKPPPRGGGGAPPTDSVQARPPRERPEGLRQMRAYLGRVPRAGR